jgi:Ca-activated chloride channel family protein
MRSPARTIATLVSALLVVGLPALASDPTTPGALSVTGTDGVLVDMPLRHTKVSIQVTAFVARTTVEQTFASPFDHPVEAVYTFPLGDRAAVDDFELTVGERTIRGEIKRREEARQVYEDARAAGYQAALLEQERPNIFTQSVANLEPGKSVIVRLRTVETLRYERGSYRLAFPLVVGPRYIPGGTVGDAARITSPPLRPGRRSGHDVEISVSIDAGVPLHDLSSASHRVTIDKTGATGARVRLANDDSIPNKDFQLRWSVASERPTVGLLAHRDGLDGFFTLLVHPKGEIAVNEASPKEIVLVVDTSGSMSGIPLDASKRFIAKALHELGPRDTFNVIRFAGDNEVFSKDPLPNTADSVERAIAWVNSRQGGGGTEMLAALRAAFARPPDPNRVRVVIFFTDGYIGNDPEILGEIGRVLGEARIYTVGIGTSVNRYLLDRMADLGRGAFVTIRPDEAADDAMEAFRSWVTRPYLTDLSIDWGSLPIADVTPERLPDLGSGQTLTVVGRYLIGAGGDVVVRGKLGGRYWEQRLHVALPNAEARHGALASLWARGRIEELLLTAPDAVSDSVRAEVTSLALTYRLMSPFTSFVAVDDSLVVNPSGVAPTIHQALPVPEGVSFEGIFGKDGPRALSPDGDGNPDVEGARDIRGDAAKEGSMGGVVGGVVGGFAEVVLAPASAPSPQMPPKSHKVETVTVAAERKAFPGKAADMTTVFSSDFIHGLPVAGRAYKSVLALSPGVADRRESDGETKEPLMARDRLRESAFRILADLADDGKLTAAEGRPALAALLGAQVQTGAIAQDVITHAVATWALAEAAVAMPKDPWALAARTRALDYLTGLAVKDGWPARPGGAIDAEATRWVRLVLGALRPSAIAAVPVPSGQASEEYVRLRDAIAAGRSGAVAAQVKGRAAFDRLVATVGRGHLTI